MDSENIAAELAKSKTDLFFKALGGEAVDAQCITCKAVEWVILLDAVLDENFIANYLCDHCEGHQASVEAPGIIP